MVEVKLSFESIDAALVAMAKLTNPSMVKDAPPATGPKPDRKGRNDKGQKRGRRRFGTAPTPSPEAPAPTTGAAPTGEATLQAPTNPQPATAPVPEETLKAKWQAFFDAKGVETSMAVLQRFGLAKVRDLKPEHRGAFIAKLDAVLAGEAV